MISQLIKSEKNEQRLEKATTDEEKNKKSEQHNTVPPKNF